MPRTDGKPGYKIVTPTKMSFKEADGSDIRIRRVRLFNEDGELEHAKLVDPIGQNFKDNLDGTEDDPDYLKQSA